MKQYRYSDYPWWIIFSSSFSPFISNLLFIDLLIYWSIAVLVVQQQHGDKNIQPNLKTSKCNGGGLLQHCQKYKIFPLKYAK